MGRDWRFAVSPANGGSFTEVPWRTAKFGWVLSSPGYVEVDLLEEDVSDLWTPGNHRIAVMEDGTAVGNLWGDFYLTHLSRSGGPDDPRFRGSGIGLESIFDWRIVHHEWAARMTVPEHLETLLDDLQNLQGPGMGFDDNVAVGLGSFTNEPLLSTCLGVVAGDFIRELAARGNGFDWEIDVFTNGDPYVLTLYKPQQGTNQLSQVIGPENCQSWEVTLDTSDLITTVTAIGEQSDPWGPRHNLARTGLGDVYGRREVVIDTDHGGDGDADEIRDKLYEAAYEELSRRAGARLQVTATWIDGTPNAPWNFAAVWKGDRVTLDLPDYFGGSQTGRCTELSMSLEPGSNSHPTQTAVPGLEVVTYKFDALVTDITEGAESS